MAQIFTEYESDLGHKSGEAQEPRLSIKEIKPRSQASKPLNP
jgi:hypothetical protein